MIKLLPKNEASTFKDIPVNPLSANRTKWSNTLKQFVGKLPTNCLSVFDHFVRLALKRLKLWSARFIYTLAFSRKLSVFL